MKTKLLAATLLLAVGTAFGAEIGIGIEIGPPPPPRVVHVPRSPGADYVWIGGYWYVVGHSWRWHDGYWTRPPYAGATWVLPRHEGGRFFEGYWEGPHGRVAHDHAWDHDHDRDFRDRH
jgi:hypothetical protein